MGCLSVKITDVSSRLSATFIERGNRLAASFSDTSSRLSASFGVVCSLADVFYVYVTPTEVQWITEENDQITYDILSNTKWIVVTQLKQD